jgi:hypothetical protein
LQYSSFSIDPEEATAEKRNKMAVKIRAAAIAVLCMLLMLSGQQQEAAAAMSKYCECYTGCYTGCRHHLPPWACVLLCIADCGPTKPGNGDNGNSGATACSLGCSLFSICSSSTALPGKPIDHLDFLMALHLLRLFYLINNDRIYSFFSYMT